MLEHMRDFYPFIEDIHTTIIGGTVQIFFHEKGLQKLFLPHGFQTGA